MDERDTKPNRLHREFSPYLLQHADNPVNWYAWGEEAFREAAALDKPIFLSIGYSTCHWCHVMAHESFEDAQVAKMLNDGFVAIKVDREERPDIDEVYMSVCQAMTGSGGWPLSIFMTADKKPFFAGTYFPKRSTQGRIGLMELCENIMRLWKTDRSRLMENSDLIMEHLSKQSKAGSDSPDADVLIKRCYAGLAESFDRDFGGFSQSPKFPSPHNILFLLKYAKAYDDASALSMADQTLMYMYRGGIYDHIGGGFSRYATDRKWLVPHFEKMLYDNAMLLLAYSEAYSVSKNNVFKNVIEGIALYILRDMTKDDGGFFSAEDADSQGEEGKFYVFGYKELEKALSSEELRFLENNFGVSRGGNFEGKNILHSTGSVVERPAVLDKLYKLREQRTRPFKDTKCSVSWNGLMIEALCRAGEVTGNPAYINSAKKAADFILRKAHDAGELFGIYQDGAKPGRAFLADYANFIKGLISLFDATLQNHYLTAAKSLALEMVSLFWEDKESRFYMTRKEDGELFLRPRDDYDGAMPSGNSSAISCLGRLAELTGLDIYADLFNQAADGFMAVAAGMPGAYAAFISSLFKKTVPHRQIILIADKDNEAARQVYSRLMQEYLPFTTLIFYDGSVEAKQAFPQLESYDASQTFAAYICENFACQNPIYKADELLLRLGLSTE